MPQIDGAALAALEVQTGKALLHSGAPDLSDPFHLKPFYDLTSKSQDFPPVVSVIPESDP